mgnify:CR=1 FL=1
MTRPSTPLLDRVRVPADLRTLKSSELPQLAAELEKLVDSRQFAVAFSMHATTVDQLMAISDAGQIMPPKSTWFEPKLRDAMFCHMVD